MNRILIDTNVLIVAWRNPGIRSPEGNDLSTQCISSVTYIEFLQGANKRQKAKAKRFLNNYEHIRLDKFTCDKAIELIDIYSEADGLRLADAFIAATSIVHDLPLLTFNRRHFQNITGLNLI